MEESDAQNKAAHEVTIADLDKIIEDIVKEYALLEVEESKVKERNKGIGRLEGKLTQILKDLGREKYETPLAKVALKQKWRVNMPANDIAKRELFDHLRERGIFDKYATVNSNSLNALYMADWKDAEEKGEGLGFTMPGIEAPKLYETTDIKPIKKKG